MNLQPVSTSVSDLFVWEAAVPTIASNIAPNNKTSAPTLQLDYDRCFVLMGFVGASNYDAFAGDFIAVIGAGPAAARTFVTPPFAPNNFEVDVTYNHDYRITGDAMPQACICSSGYRSGNQLPYPVIFAPMTTFDFDFYNVAQTLLLTGAGAALDLQIYFGLMGYFVKTDGLGDFLLSYPAYAAEAQRTGGNWVSKFTGVTAYSQMVQ